ncbi:RNA polymerase I-specific transcription initiation factor-domain-containing protein [Halenospora varia]|nr:RNA polymerase I-specific transcription initiation factor-domain-containing protein [Halenospora varia]
MDDAIQFSGIEDTTLDTSESARPNRWDGPAGTWQSLTEQERGLAASLDDLRNRDLSIHLYNAFALKKRAADINTKVAAGLEVDEEDAEDPFVPPKSWTAWPLPPSEVPREGEPLGEEDPDEKYTFRMRQSDRPSRNLEEVLIGLSLKFAKETFEERGWASGDENLKNKGGPEKRQKKTIDESGDESVEDEDSEPTIKGSAEQPTTLTPVIAADDERSRQLLRPTVRHTLSKLDDILMALHHARKTCRRYSETITDVGESEDSISDAEGEPNNSREEAPTFGNLAHRSKSGRYGKNGEELAEGDILRPKKSGRGRKPKQYPRIEDETEQEYHIRVARAQKKPLPTYASRKPTGPASGEKSPASRAPTPTPTPRQNRRNPEEAADKHHRRLGLRDWSEVLGSAALIGIPADAIARATQRCANLFGEGMTMRSMPEVPFSESSADFLSTYRPEEIPDLGSDSISSESASEDSEPETTKPIKYARPLGNAPKTQTCFCPVRDCPREIQGFRNKQHLDKHLKRAHKMSREEIDEYDIPSDDEMEGAVHVDGFLRPEKRAWREKPFDHGASKRIKSEAIASSPEREASSKKNQEASNLRETMRSTSYDFEQKARKDETS